MKGSNFEDIVDRTRLQYSIYQLENIPEEYYLRHEEDARDNNSTDMLNFIILLFNNKFRIANNQMWFKRCSRLVVPNPLHYLYKFIFV